MEHKFDIDVAHEFGIPEAILVQNFQHWITRNRANGENLRDGRFWTYNSVKALKRVFYYFGKGDQVRRALERLVEKGVLLKGDYSPKSNPVTWYAFADESRFLGALDPSDPLASTPKQPLASAPTPSAPAPKGNGTSAIATIYKDKNQKIETTDSAQADEVLLGRALVVPENRPPVEQVFAHWQSVMQSPRAKLDAKRRAAVQARLNDGYTVEDLMHAIDGCRKSDWHMGRNEKNRAFNDLELICRDAARVDGFMAQGKVAPVAAGRDDDIQGYLQRRQQRQAGNEPYTIDMEA